MKLFLAAAALTFALSAPALAVDMTEAQCAAKISQLGEAISPSGGGTGGVQSNKIRTQLENARNALSNNNMVACYNATTTAEGALMGNQ